MDFKSILISAARFGLLNVCVMMLVACASAPKQTINYWPVSNIKTEASDKPAQVTPLSEIQLMEQGYVKIGNISVEQVVRECYESILRLGSGRYDSCSEHAYPEDPTSALAKHAAEKGGHLVALSVNTKLEMRDTKKVTGLCRRSHWETREEWVFVSSAKGMQPVKRTYDICDEFEVARGQHSVKRSSGSVWRKLP